jgi:hypothetical protein
MRWIHMLLVASIAVAGCATPPAPLSTPSGRPEVTITGVSKKQVADAIVAGALARGSQIKSVNEYAVVLTQRVHGNLGASLAYGSRYDSTPEVRVTLNMVDVSGGVKVYARGEMVTNPGSAFERLNDVTAHQAANLQTSLVDLKSRFPGR